jgi:indole-3-acetate monooxygenase
MTGEAARQFGSSRRMTMILDKERSAAGNVQSPDAATLDQVLSRVTALAPIFARHACEI